MTAEVIQALGVIVLGITGGFFAMMRYIVKTLAELRPNSGSSIKDKVDINSRKLEKIEERVDNIYEILAKKG